MKQDMDETNQEINSGGKTQTNRNTKKTFKNKMTDKL